MFSEEPFEKPVAYGKYSLFPPSDGDIYFLLKNYIEEIPEVEELPSRELSKTPLWKTDAEFFHYFKDWSDQQLAYLRTRVTSELSQMPGCDKSEILAFKVKPKYAEISRNQAFIKLSSGELADYEKIVAQKSPKTDDTPYFHVFIPMADIDRKQARVNCLKKFSVPQI